MGQTIAIMRKAALLYNPSSGSRQERRLADVETVLKLLRAAGVQVAASPTGGSYRAAEQVRQAIAEGSDTVFACGGDGTIHDVLQALVGSQTSLAIIPLGTANTLAHDLGIPHHPRRAAQAALQAHSRRFAVGRVEYREFSGKQSSRYFTVAVGVGVDAYLFYKLNARVKQRIGMTAYYAKATHLWFTHPLSLFPIEYVEAASQRRRKENVSELLAVRITDFGGILRQFAPGAALARNDARLVMFKTRSRLRYLLYILRGLLGLRWNVPGIELRDVSSVTCGPDPQRVKPDRIFVEADGELLGTVPAEISIVPDAVTILVPHQ